MKRSDKHTSGTEKTATQLPELTAEQLSAVQGGRGGVNGSGRGRTAN
jgi:hypothetical protein